MANLLNAAMFLAFVGFLGPHPAPAVSRLYQPGSVYEYSYDSAVRLNELPVTGREVGYKIAGSVRLSSVWQSPADPNEKLLKIEFNGVKLHVHSVQTPDHQLQAHASRLDSTSRLPTFLHWKNGEAVGVYVANDVKDETKNLKKGLASLFQIRAVNAQNEAEMDVSGVCQVAYKVNGASLVKTKTSCRLPDQGQLEQYSRNEVRSTKIDSQATLSYNLNSDSSIKTVDVRENLVMSVNLWRKAALSVEAISKLGYVSDKQGGDIVEQNTVEEAIQALAAKQKLKYNLEKLYAVPEVYNPCSTGNCKKLSEVIKEYHERLKPENIAKVKSANAFLRVVERMKLSSKDEVLEVFKDGKNKKILPQLMDAAAATQTEPAITAALTQINLLGDELDISERFFLCLALSSHPKEFLLKQLHRASQKAKNEKLKATTLISLGSATKTYCSNRDKAACENSQLVREIREYLTNGIEKCKTDFCKSSFVRGLVNMGSQDTLTELLGVIKRGGKLAVPALLAIQSIGPEHLNVTVLDELAVVYHQLRKPYDSTSRLLAIEIIFRSKSEKIKKYVQDFAFSLSNQLAPEVSTFALAKLLEVAEKDHALTNVLKEVARDRTVWNYYTVAQKGSSAAFSRILARSEGLNSTYGVNMEMIGGGVLKRSSFDVHLESEPSQLRLVSVGLFAEGLGGFGGGGDNEETEEETSAGMELTIMGVRLRPYTFFTGTGELMGHVWSGTGSEPTAAMRANVMLQDILGFYALHNGLVAEMDLQGAVSADLSGSISISLWNRNSHSLVKSSGALLMHGAIRLDTPYAKSHVEFAMGGEALIDFLTDLDFYDKPFKTCIQMIQPGFNFRYNVRKSESVPGSKHVVKTLRKRTIFVPGKSYSLHRKNFISCSTMLTDS